MKHFKQILRILQQDHIFTIPNGLSFFRILLIPAIVATYLAQQDTLAVLLLCLSGLTDVLDGWIARKFQMVSNLGKVLDPLADKLTQAAMVVCLLSRYPQLWAVLAIFVIKEIFQLAAAYAAVRATNAVTSSKWYGKVSTATLYVCVGLLFLFPTMPDPAANALITLCGFVLLLAMILYGRHFLTLARK